MNAAYRAFWPGRSAAHAPPSSRARRARTRASRSRWSRCRAGASARSLLPAGLEALAQSLQLRDPQRRHAVPLGPGVEKRHRQRVRRRATCARRRARSWRTPAQLLEAAGMTFANIVSARIYLTNAADFAAMNEVYAEFFPTSPPARATVECRSRRTGSRRRDHVRRVGCAADGDRHAAVGAAAQSGGEGRQPRLRLGHARQHSRRRPATSPHRRARRWRGSAGRSRDAGASPADVVEGLVYITDAVGVRGDEQGVSRSSSAARFPARATVVTPLVAPDGARRDHGDCGGSR